MTAAEKLEIVHEFGKLEIWDSATFRVDEHTVVTGLVEDHDYKWAQLNVAGLTLRLTPEQFVRAERRLPEFNIGDEVELRMVEGATDNLYDGQVGVVQPRPDYQLEFSASAVPVLWESETRAVFMRANRLRKVSEVLEVPNALELRAGDLVLEPAVVGTGVKVRRRCE